MNITSAMALARRNSGTGRNSRWDWGWSHSQTPIKEETGLWDIER